MRVGILTMTFNNNYGGVLQAYSLYKNIELLGHEPVLIDCRLVEIKFWKLPFIICKRFLYKYILRINKYDYLIPEEFLVQTNKYIERCFDMFINSHFVNKTKPIYNDKEFLKKISPKDFDAFVVGSDQVWRKKMYKFFSFAFFGFVENKSIPLIAYSPSFGVDKWEYSQIETDRIKKEIKYFKAVSVREESGVILCKEFLNIDAQLLLDPTLLFTIDKYKSLFTNTLIDKDFIALYFLDYEDIKFKYAQFIAQNKRIELKFINNIHHSNRRLNKKDRVMPSVESWLCNIYYSKFVITDSYHGVIFSILFNKPFVVFENEFRGNSRINNILNIFNLTNRLVSIQNIDNFDASILNDDINWSYINNKMQNMRDTSLHFLKTNLQ